MNTSRRMALLSVSFAFLNCFQVYAKTITVNNKQITTGKVYELSYFIKNDSVDKFYEIIQAHPVFVDFYSKTCGPCKTMAPRFAELAKEADDVLFIKVNYEEFYRIGKELEVNTLPTFISFKNGQQVARIKGSVSKKELRSLSGLF